MPVFYNFIKFIDKTKLWDSKIDLPQKFKQIEKVAVFVSEINLLHFNVTDFGFESYGTINFGYSTVYFINQKESDEKKNHFYDYLFQV